MQPKCSEKFLAKKCRSTKLEWIIFATSKRSQSILHNFFNPTYLSLFLIEINACELCNYSSMSKMDTDN